MDEETCGEGEPKQTTALALINTDQADYYDEQEQKEYIHYRRAKRAGWFD